MSIVPRYLASTCDRASSPLIATPVKIGLVSLRTARVGGSGEPSPPFTVCAGADREAPGVVSMHHGHAPIAAVQHVSSATASYSLLRLPLDSGSRRPHRPSYEALRVTVHRSPCAPGPTLRLTGEHLRNVNSISRTPHVMNGRARRVVHGSPHALLSGFPRPR